MTDRPGNHNINTGEDKRVSALAAGNTRPFGYSVSDAARYLGVSIGSIRRWADSGALQCHRTPGGQRRFTREQLDAVANAEQER